MDAADLLVLGEDLVCPRCYALMAPAGAPSAPDEDAMAPPSAPAVAQAPARIEAAAAHRGSDMAHSGSDMAHSGPDMTHPPPDMARPGSRITGAWQRLERSIRAWATGRTWWVRAPLLVWFAWLLFRYWGDRTYQSIWHGINLG
ncbi:MAG TPA: hypothetical protein VK966_12980, partial [Longimicrobiales bacterium]|nr:hypothetical protein [Longimicrobiales bacterium]